MIRLPNETPQRRRERDDSLVPANGLARLLPTCEESREVLIHLGVPSHSIPAYGVDLIALVCSLDRLFATGCGHAGVRWFLSEPDPDLNGRSPVELIDEPDGVERIRHLVAREIALTKR